MIFGWTVEVLVGHFPLKTSDLEETEETFAPPTAPKTFFASL